jgi:hypothetical protein
VYKKEIKHPGSVATPFLFEDFGTSIFAGFGKVDTQRWQFSTREKPSWSRKCPVCYAGIL